MTTRLQTLFNRAKNIYQEEGLLITIKRTLGFAKYLISLVISYENSIFYVQGRTMTESNEADYLPKIKDTTYRELETIEQLDELSKEGFDLSLLDIGLSHYRLGKGAIAHLIFVDHEIGYMGWTAMSKEAQRTINRYPYKVDYENHEVTSGAAWTNPKYRRQGLANYGAYKQGQFLRGRGAIKYRTIKYTNNIASVEMDIKRGTPIIAKARYVRIFGLELWREKPVRPTDNEERINKELILLR